MSYFVTPQASSSQIAGAINYILANLNTNVNPNFTTGIVNSTTTTATGPSGQTTAYLYRYLDVAYADNGSGSVNFSSSPLSTNKFYGLRNTNSSTYSTNPADYVWYQINGTFSGGNLLWYQTFGGLQINLVVATSQPTPAYQNPIAATAIDLTQVSTATNLQGRSAYAVTSTTLGNTPATYSTTSNSTFPPDNTWGGSEHWVANPPSYTAGQNVYQIDGIYNPANNLTLWAAPYLATLKVGNLSAINANLGTITAGTLNAVTVEVGPTPTTYPVIDSVNHTISSGSGALINPNGTFAFGNTSTNIVDDGSGVYLNGLVNANGSAVGSFPMGATASPTLMPYGTGSTFTTTKKANTIITSYGFCLAYTTYTSGPTPTGCSIYLLFRLLNSSNTIVQQWTQQFAAGVYTISTTSPYSQGLGFNYSFSGIINNLPPDSYTLICYGPASYASTIWITSSGSVIPSINFSMQLSANSYWYQVG